MLPMKVIDIRLKTIKYFHRFNSIGCLLLVAVFLANTVFLRQAISREYPVREVTATPIDHALRDSLLDNNYDLFIENLAAGGDPTEWFENSEQGWVMCAATDIGREEYLRLIIDAGFDINFRQSDVASHLSSALLCALSYKNLSAIKNLIKAGADPTIKVCLVCDTRIATSLLSMTALSSNYDIAIWLFENTEYRPEQIQAVVSFIETSPFPSEVPQNINRLKLAELLREQGYEVTPWSDSNR